MNGNIWATILPLVILIAVMYFLLIRPQKKREKEVNAMRSGVQVGDEIITMQLLERAEGFLAGAGAGALGACALGG